LDKKRFDLSNSRVSDIFVASEDEDSLYLHAYVFSIRHWGTAKAWRCERIMVVHEEDTSVPSMGRGRLWPGSV